MEVEPRTGCNGWLSWEVTKVIGYNGITGEPSNLTNGTVSKKSIPWMEFCVSYCLGTILFQISSDEIPHDKELSEMSRFGGDIRTYAIIKPELEFCKCATWSEEEHTAFCEAMDEFASLGLTLHIEFNIRKNLCKIPNEYEIPTFGRGRLLGSKRRWKPKVDE